MKDFFCLFFLWALNRGEEKLEFWKQEIIFFFELWTDMKKKNVFFYKSPWLNFWKDESQITDVFFFFIGYYGEFEIFENKSLKIGNSRYKKSANNFYEDHWEKDSGQVWKRLASIVGGVAFRHFYSHRSHVNENEKKMLKFQKVAPLFCEDHWDEIWS